MQDKEGKMFNQAIWQVVQSRHDELLRAAETGKLVKAAQARRPNRNAHRVASLGDLMVSGLRSKARPQPSRKGVVSR
jgi:hypothetical protein